MTVKTMKDYDEFLEKCDFIGDIEITEEEYKDLIAATKREINQALHLASHNIKNKSIVAIALVQIGIRECKGRNYWDEVHRVLETNDNTRSIVYNILKETPAVLDMSEDLVQRIQN